MYQATVAELQALPEFSHVPAQHLQWLLDHSEILEFNVGDPLFSPGAPADHMYIILQGAFSIRLQTGNQYRDAGELEAGSITGVLPYSRMKSARATSTATKPSVVLSTHRSQFKPMAQESEELVQALVSVMTSRVREFTKRQQQNEKMLSLGKLSAGLAHELNNPASAVVRSAQALKQHLSYQPESFKKVIQIRMSNEQVDAANKVIFEALAKEPSTLSLLERTDLEDELADWLEDHGMENGVEIAEVLVEYSMTVEELEQINTVVPDADLGAVLGWVANVMTTEKMVQEIEEASSRIAELVKSIKAYTHMDRAPEKELTDIHKGIRNTITMLGHRLKKKNIELVQNFDANLPLVSLFVSEINQVWTNLIDNAIDAMEQGGRLEIITVQDGDFAKIEVIDNGAGIPEDVIDQIFDPFFTTKDIGKGTGIGLEVVQRIVQLQHRGKVSVASKPGRTVFSVCLPLNSSNS